MILEGVIQVPSPSSESERTSPLRDSTIDDSVGVCNPSSSSSYRVLVLAEARDPVVVDADGSKVAFAVEVVLSLLRAIPGWPL